MAEQKGFVDFNQGLGDTGQDNISSIQPITDGEGANQLVFRRPSENLRERTEILREDLGELQYYRDYSHLMISYTGSDPITWNGTSISPNGKIGFIGGNIILSPMLAPSTTKRGSISSGTATVNQITYTVSNTAYATHGMNAVTFKHLDGGPGAVLAVTISDGPVKRIAVTFDSTNTAHTAAAVATAVNTALSGDTALTGKITITTDALPTGAISALVETRLEGTADDEQHVIAGSAIQALTIATPLTAGKGIGVWYRYVIEPAGYTGDPKGGVPGGRAESSGSRGNSTVQSAQLFVTDNDPAKIPGAIPLCRVTSTGQLVWYDGTRQESGESIKFRSPTSVAAADLSAQVALYASQAPSEGAALIGYDGSGNWLDSTSLPASTVNAALDNIVSALASSSGAAKIGYDGSGNWLDSTSLPASSVNAGLDNIVSALASSAGAAKIGYDGSGNWLDSTSLPASSINAALDNIVSALASSAGAAKIGYNGSGNWYDSTSLPASSVNAALDSIVSELASNTGAVKIGAAPAYLLSNGSVTGVINEIDYRLISTAVGRHISAVATTPENLNGVTYDSTAGRFVAVGDNGSVLTSEYGHTSWTAGTFGGGSNTEMRGVAANAGLFIAVGATNIQTSNNGLTWTRQITSGLYTSICYGNGKFVATDVVYPSSVKVTTNGTSYTTHAVSGGTDAYYYGSVYGAGLYVIVGDLSNTIQIETSPDGITWTVRPLPAPTVGSLKAVAYANSLFVAVGSTKKIYTSPDGITWTARSTGIEHTGVGGNTLLSVINVEGIWIVGDDTGHILTSQDGFTWKVAGRREFTTDINSFAYRPDIQRLVLATDLFSGEAIQYATL